jgi:hypothetical protein
MDSKMLSRKLPKTRFIATGFTVLQIIAFGVSTLHHGQVDYVTYVVSKEELVTNLFIDVPALFLKNFGFEGGVKVGNMGSILHMMLIAFLVLVVMALVGICGKNRENRAMDALGFFICMFSVAAALMILLTAGKLSYYLFAAWFVAVLAIAIYSEKLTDEKKGFTHLIVLAGVVFSVMNLSYTYKGAIDCEDNLAKYEEVTDYMKNEGLYYGYAEFWDANRLAVVTDGELVFGCSYLMEDLEMYWWLTNTDWYPPTMPGEMRTAYVIRKGKEAGFLSQFDDPSIMEEAFANERFTVYVSDYNLVNKP